MWSVDMILGEFEADQWFYGYEGSGPTLSNTVPPTHVEVRLHPHLIYVQKSERRCFGP